MANNTFLGTFLDSGVLFLKPLKTALSTEGAFKDLMRKLGWDVFNVQLTVFNNISSKLDDLFNSFDALTSNPTEIDILTTLKKIGVVYTQIQNDINSISGAMSGIAPLQSQFQQEVPSALFEYLINQFLNERFPKIYNALIFLKIIEYEYIPENLPRPSFVKSKINFNQIPEVITNPIGLIKEKINWNTIDFDFADFARLLMNLLHASNISAEYTNDPGGIGYKYTGVFNNSDKHSQLVSSILGSTYVNNEYKDVLLNIIDVQGLTVNDKGLIIEIEIPENISPEVNLSDDLKLSLSLSSVIGDSLLFRIKPSGINFKFLEQLSQSLPTVGIAIKFIYTPDVPSLIIGKSQGTRLELGNASIGVNALLENNEVELMAEADLNGLSFIVNAGDADGFISKVFGEGEKKIKLPVIVSWSSKHGIRFKGSGAFEVAVNPNISIGPIQIRKLLLALKAIQNQPIKAEIAATIGGELGPVAFIVEEVGLALKLDNDTNNGNAGPFDIDLGFKPPSGIGLSIDTAALKGGGYVYINPDKGLYYGAFELQIVNKLGVSAVAIITTKKPDGSKGFSLLVTLAVTFPVSIPIGFGFSLRGVGGIGGVHRDVDPIPIRDGVRNGTIDNILFPQDVVANIDSIINDLSACFPAVEGRYTFGVFFLLGWGVGIKLIDIKFGIIVNLPSPVRLLIIGTVKIALPNPEAPIVKINVAFAGYIDFGKKFMLFDASIYDSKILILSLEGDIAVRIFWGDHKEMLLSVGGFHPAYSAPTYLMLPANMKRLSISIVDTDIIKLKLATYFAITSNTVQFGARIDFLLEVWKFQIVGLFGIDVLFQFKPFKMMANTYAQLSVMWDGEVVLGISLDFFIEGPGPWHARGDAIFTVLGMTQDAHFDRTFGDYQPQAPVPGIAIMPLLEDALEKDESWSTEMPGEQQIHVQLKNLDDEDLVMHPLGVLTVMQKVVPLGVKIQRFGTQVPTDGGEYNITAFKVGGDPQIREIARECFAPAQFRDMSDEEKLESAAFEYLRAGERATSTAGVESGGTFQFDAVHETILVDGTERLYLGSDTPATEFVNDFVSGGLLGRNPISRRLKDMTERPIPHVKVRQERYKIVMRESLDDTTYGTFNSLAEALNKKDTLFPNTVLVVPIGGDYNDPLLGTGGGGGGIQWTNVGNQDLSQVGTVLVGGIGISQGGGGGVVLGGWSVDNTSVLNSYYQLGNGIQISSF